MAKKPNPFIAKFENNPKEKKEDAKGVRKLEAAAKAKSKGKGKK